MLHFDAPERLFLVNFALYRWYNRQVKAAFTQFVAAPVKLAVLAVVPEASGCSRQ